MNRNRTPSAIPSYTILILLATLGMLLMISANDFIALYVGLEMSSLALYVIASFHRDDVRSVEAGLKYFVLGALASGMLLYGASLIYGYAGTTGFAAIGTAISTLHGAIPVGLMVGLVFVIAGLAFKVSAVPFHMWTPDVYEGAPTPVTAFFSLAPKVAAIALLLRVMMEPFGDMVAQWRQIIVFLSIASMLLGAFAAIGQTNIKRLMAYSSISNIGYALIGLAAVLLMALHGRIMGATGVLTGAIFPGGPGDRGWRLAVLAGMVSAPLAWRLASGGWPAIDVPVSLPMLALGLLR